MLLAAAACMIGTTAQSQDVYKQSGGENNIEVQFAPFGGSPISIGGIRYRKFTSATTAWRADVFLGFSSNTTIDGELPPIIDGNELTNGTMTTNTFNIQVSPGLEWHLPGTDRLSPYYGAVADIGFGRTADVFDTRNEAGTEFERFGRSTSGNFLIGLNGVGGFDYYFAHNIYLGAEIGFGVAARFNLAEKFIPEDGDTFTSTGNGSSISLGPNVVSRLRLGILF